MNIITVQYAGGIGNVLFQIAAAITYSKKTNRPFLLSPHPAFPNLSTYSPQSIGIDNLEFVESAKEYSEHDAVNGTPLPENTNVILTGFFQDHTAFDSHKQLVFDIIGIPIIRNTVIPKIKLPEFKLRGLFQNVDEFSSSQSSEITISLHIRRGDYEDLACYFLLINEYYYKHALLHILSKINRPNLKIKVLCFYANPASESVHKIINALQTDPHLSLYSIEYAKFNDIIKSPATDIEEMAIISHCDHHIVANSTYSWWAAYISPTKNKIICYPDEYYNHNLYYLSMEGLKVDGWTSIKAWNPFEHKCDCY